MQNVRGQIHQVAKPFYSQLPNQTLVSHFGFAIRNSSAVAILRFYNLCHKTRQIPTLMHPITKKPPFPTKAKKTQQFQSSSIIQSLYKSIDSTLNFFPYIQ